MSRQPPTIHLTKDAHSDGEACIRSEELSPVEEVSLRLDSVSHSYFYLRKYKSKKPDWHKLFPSINRSKHRTDTLSDVRMVFTRIDLIWHLGLLRLDTLIFAYGGTHEMATLPSSGWSNVKGSGGKTCPCGTWKAHWLKHSGKSWPSYCSVGGCLNSAVLGAHVKNSGVTGNRIVPMCDDCNKREDTFNLTGTLTYADAAN